MSYLAAAGCVMAISIGQIMFKLCATEIKVAGTPFAAKPILLFVSSMVIYGLATLAWIWVLQKLDLSRAYPFMAAAFILVPLGSYFLLGEKMNLQYAIGSSIILLGVIVTVRS